MSFDDYTFPGNPWDDIIDGITEHEVISLNASYIYPNPAKDNLQVSITSTINNKLEISVVNLIGETLKTTTSTVVNGNNTISFEVTDLPSGMYLVRLKLGSNSISKKLIVE